MFTDGAPNRRNIYDFDFTLSRSRDAAEKKKMSLDGDDQLSL